MTEVPLVSVLIFAYNHEKFIEQTILSVLEQKCNFDFEIIVTDDFSSDNTVRIIEVLKDSFPNSFVLLRNAKNIGLNSSFYNAVLAAKGKFIALLGGDDYWIMNNKLQRQVDILQNNNEVAYVHTNFWTLSEVTGEIEKKDNRAWKSILIRENGYEALFASLMHQWSFYPLSSSCCFRKAPLIKGMKLHPEILNYSLSGEGTIIHSSITLYGGLYAFLPEATTMYRIRRRSLSRFESQSERFDFLFKYANVRKLAAKSFSINEGDGAKLERKLMFELLNFSIANNFFEKVPQIRDLVNGFNVTFFKVLSFMVHRQLFKLFLKISLKSFDKIQSIKLERFKV